MIELITLYHTVRLAARSAAVIDEISASSTALVNIM